MNARQESYSNTKCVHSLEGVLVHTYHLVHTKIYLVIFNYYKRNSLIEPDFADPLLYGVTVFHCNTANARTQGLYYAVHYKAGGGGGFLQEAKNMCFNHNFICSF